jgi:long-chain acyl-CoA synthetase
VSDGARSPDGLVEEPLDRAADLARHAGADPDRPAISSENGDRTFGELDGRVNQLVKALRSRGLGTGDAIALMSPNRPEFVEVYFAALRGGFRLTPINWHLTAGEAGYIIDDCEAKAFLSDAGLASSALPAVEHATGARVRLSFGGEVEGFEDYGAALAGEDAGGIPDPGIGSVMLYTSGTTGRPKGVFRREPPLSRYRWHFDYHPGLDRDLAVGPLYHTAPAVYTLATALPRGVGTVLVESWDSERVLQLIERYRITHAHMVPTMFHRLLALPPEVRDSYDLSSLRVIVHGAAPCPVALKQQMIDWLGPVIYEYYAATEGPGTQVEPQEWLRKPGTVGRPEPSDHVIVGDEEGVPLPAGEVGFVYMKAPQRGRFEYFNDPGKTASAYRGDYFRLGDLGYLDDDGYLFITDRYANVIISGGVNIYPAEVDAVLMEHPAVADVAVIGVPNDEWGEEVKAVVQLASPEAESPELATELMEFCRERLARFKCPRSVDFVPELPRQDNGKLSKRTLRDRYRAAAGTPANP